MNEFTDTRTISIQEQKSNRLEIRTATIDDLELVRRVEKDSFGKNYVPEVHRQILTGKGLVILASEKDKPEPIGYVMLRFKDLEKWKVLPAVHVASGYGPGRTNIIADHFGLKADVDFYSIGIKPEARKSGLGSEMLIKVVNLLRGMENKYVWTALADFTNPSNRLLTKVCGMSAICLQDIPQEPDEYYGWPKLGSQDNNFMFSNLIAALSKVPPNIDKVPIWKLGEPDPTGNSFLLPIHTGLRESATELNEQLILNAEMLTRTMPVGEIGHPGEQFYMRGVFLPNELTEAGLRLDTLNTEFFLYFDRPTDLSKEQSAQLYRELRFAHLRRNAKFTKVTRAAHELDQLEKKYFPHRVPSERFHFEHKHRKKT